MALTSAVQQQPVDLRAAVMRCGGRLLLKSSLPAKAQLVHVDITCRLAASRPVTQQPAQRSSSKLSPDRKLRLFSKHNALAQRIQRRHRLPGPPACAAAGLMAAISGSVDPLFRIFDRLLQRRIEFGRFRHRKPASPRSAASAKSACEWLPKRLLHFFQRSLRRSCAPRGVRPASAQLTAKNRSRVRFPRAAVGIVIADGCQQRERPACSKSEMHLQQKPCTR